MLNQICLPILDEGREAIQTLLNGARRDATNVDRTMAAHRLVYGRWTPDLCPKPFHVKPVSGPGGSGMILYGYTSRSLDELRQCAVQNKEWPIDPIDWDAAKIREIPEMPAGTRLQFRLTCIPTERVSLPARNGGEDRKACEVDAFLAARHRLGDIAKPVDAYRAWVQKHFAAPPLKDEFSGDLFPGALCAEIEAFEIEAMTESSLMRPLYERGGKRVFDKFSWDQRKRARFAGTLIVKDGQKFLAKLARGVGRHRAYGMGMVMLAMCRQTGVTPQNGQE